MDLLQIALVFLILLLSIFLGIIGIQVFFILRDLKKALDKFNAADDIEKPQKESKPKPKSKRFYKKVL